MSFHLRLPEMLRLDHVIHRLAIPSQQDAQPAIAEAWPLLR
jgi:hypothetical protein